MSDTSHDLLDLLPEPHRTLAKQRRADAAREALTPNSDLPRHIRIALASATRASQSGDLSTLAAPVEEVDVEEVLRLDSEATPGPWTCYRRGKVDPSLWSAWALAEADDDFDEQQIAAEGEVADITLIATYRTAAPALAREVVALRDALGRAQSALGGEIEARRAAEQEAETLRCALATAYIDLAALATAKGELDIACREWGLIESALDAARVAATHADGDARSAWNRIALLAEERDKACRALALREGECHEWRAAARIAPAVTCAACGAAQPVPSHASNGQSPCVNCGKTDGLTWPTTPPLDVVALAKERDELRLTLAADEVKP